VVPDSDHAPVLYTQTGCAESRQVRAWLTERRITFTERNVADDHNAAEALLETGIFGTPLLIVGDRAIIGSRPDVLTAALPGTDEDVAP